MNSYRVFRHPDGAMIAVKDGFAWPGLVLGCFWLLYHRIYGLGTGALVIGAAAYVLFPSPEGYILGIPFGHRFGLADAINIAITVLVGVLGNSWRVDSLNRRGFTLVDSVDADTADGARAVYLTNRTEAGTELERRAPHEGSKSDRSERIEPRA